MRRGTPGSPVGMVTGTLGVPWSVVRASVAVTSAPHAAPGASVAGERGRIRGRGCPRRCSPSWRRRPRTSRSGPGDLAGHAGRGGIAAVAQAHRRAERLVRLEVGRRRRPRHRIAQVAPAPAPAPDSAGPARSRRRARSPDRCRHRSPGHTVARDVRAEHLDREAAGRARAARRSRGCCGGRRHRR